MFYCNSCFFPSFLFLFPCGKNCFFLLGSEFVTKLFKNRSFQPRCFRAAVFTKKPVERRGGR